MPNSEMKAFASKDSQDKQLKGQTKSVTLIKTSHKQKDHSKGVKILEKE